MRSIGIGIIGWGFMGRTHTHALRSIAMMYPGIDFSIRLVGVCSGHLENAEKAKEDLGFAFAADDYRELLKRDDIDVVSICTPNDMHEQMALDAIAAGKHVYIDKPLSVTYESAKRIADAAEKVGVCAQLVMNNRFFPSTIRAHQLIDEGRIGEITSFTGRYYHSGSVEAGKPAGWKQLMQGGVLLDLGSHILDLLTWYLGMPESVFSASRVLYPERPLRTGGTSRALAEDHIAILMKTASGVIGTVDVGKIQTGINDEMSFEIYGTKGAMKWSLTEPNWLDFFDNTIPEAPYGGMRGFKRIECVARYDKPAGTFLPPKNTIGWDRGHIHCYYSFLDCVAHGKKPQPNLRDGAALQYLMEKIKASSASGNWETL